MPIIVILVLPFVIAYFSPALAKILTWILVLGFIIPFFTFAGGTFFWSIANLFTNALFLDWNGWWGFCLIVGLPVGLLASKWVLS
jgi:hypothetical protein